MSDGSIDGLAERLDLSRRLIDAEDRTFPHARLKPSVKLASQGPRLGLTRRGAVPSGILRGLSLLVVDDNDDARQLLKVLFRHCGAHVMVAGSGRDALAMFRVRRPHVVIADLSLPHWDGYRLIREIRSLPREQGGGTPALAVTAFSEVHQDRRAFRAGLDAYLRKPVELRAITDVVRRLGRGAVCTVN